MNNNNNYLSTINALCNQRNKSLPTTGNYVKCNHCSSRYHYTPCATLSESTYSMMTAEKKSLWKCHKCRERSKSSTKSPSSSYHVFTYEENKQQQDQQDQQANKQLREDDDNQGGSNSGSKRFKDSLHPNSTNQADVSEIKSDISSLKTNVSNDMNEIKNSIQQLANSLTSSQNALREDMSNAFIKLTETMANLSTQVNELKEQNKEKDARIQNMENRVNTLEQQLLSKSIEIKNLQNNEINPIDVIKTIGASVDINMQDSDISNAYRMKKQDKIIIEFCSLNKKIELMSKIRGHRVAREIFNNRTTTTNSVNHNNNNNNDFNQRNKDNNYVFINDLLSPHNRRLLWQAKTKAKECGWQFVWVRNGHLFAKKSENSTAVLILNACDIELIA